MRVDHLVWYCDDLKAGERYFAERMDRGSIYGGIHPGVGTANRLLSLADASYLEILGRDPARARSSLAPKIRGLSGSGLYHWAIGEGGSFCIAPEGECGRPRWQRPMTGGRASDDGDGDEARTLRPLQAAAITCRIAFGPRAGQKVLTLWGAMVREGVAREFLCSDIDGFSLHAAVRVQAHERKRLEQRCRYIARPAQSDEQVQLNATGQVELKLKTTWPAALVCTRSLARAGRVMQLLQRLLRV